MGVFVVLSCLFLQASAYAKADPEGQTGPPAQAKAADDPGLVIIMFPLITRGEPNGRIVERTQSEIEAVARRISGARVIARPELRSRIKERPRKALYRCGMNLGCLAALGAKAGADEILIGRATGNRRLVKITFLVINGATAKVARNVSLELASPAGARPAIERMLTKIFGEGVTLEPKPRGPAEEAPATQASTEGEAEPEAAHAPDAVSEEVAAAQPAEEEGAEVGTGPSSAALALALAPTPFDEASILASAEPVRRGSTSLLVYGGIGFAGLGAGTLGTAGYFGRRSNAVREDIKRDGSITQRQALDMGNEANRLGRRANLLLLIGGGLLLTGGALLGVDWLFVGTAPAPEATP